MIDRVLAARSGGDTRYAWGEIWTRPGLPRTTRSLVTLAAMVALHRTEELRMHLRAALRNGVPRGQIKEVLLQMAKASPRRSRSSSRPSTCA